jgi:hypothetical protein
MIMNRSTFALFGAAAFALAGCMGDPNDRLVGSHDPDSLAAGEGNTQHHFQQMGSDENGEYNNDPNQVTQADQQVGGPVAAARMHGCSKIPYTALGSILSTRGVNVTNTTAMSAGQLYRTGGSALGVANYAGRVPEAVIASTAALSKEFDIMVAAGIELQKNKPAMSGCQGVQLVDAQGNFTQDGLSCLMGKPASTTHVTVANDAITQAQAKGLTQAEGQQIAVAALLEAAHTCE